MYGLQSIFGDRCRNYPLARYSAPHGSKCSPSWDSRGGNIVVLTREINQLLAEYRVSLCVRQRPQMRGAHPIDHAWSSPSGLGWAFLCPGPTLAIGSEQSGSDVIPKQGSS
jgi:hypothetical protein